MLGLFEKKLFLKDQLDGLVDIHNHLLPGIDDGASSTEDSIALIRRFREMGISNFISTPHVMNDYYPNTPATIHAALDKLRAALENAGMSDVQIKAAAEYMLDHSFLDILEKGNILSLTEELVLVEMSYFQAPINLNELLFELQAKGFKPVMAHPERYSYFHSRKLEKFEELKNRGCLFQLNILSLVGHYGKNVQDVAFRLLDMEMIDYIGSDTHQMRHLDKLSEAKLPRKRIEQLLPVFQRTRETFL